MPKVGETLTANSFECLPGGKGANSIVAGSRLGSNNAFICKLGTDSFGKEFINVLKADNINIENVSFSSDKPTSIASIVVDKSGANFCVVNFGATLELSVADINNAEEAVKNSKILVTTRMIREETALHALKLGKQHGCLTVFNFAPALSDLSEEFNAYVDLLVVNEIEAEVFTGNSVKTIDEAKEACRTVLARDGFYIGCVVTLGGQGCVYGDKKTGGIKHFPCKAVSVVDSTGAGDAFVGSLAHFVSFLGVESMHEAIELASEYATVSVTSKVLCNFYYLFFINFITSSGLLIFSALFIGFIF